MKKLRPWLTRNGKRWDSSSLRYSVNPICIQLDLVLREISPSVPLDLIFTVFDVLEGSMLQEFQDSHRIAGRVQAFWKLLTSAMNLRYFSECRSH
jgi:hypothetical protein